MRGVCVLTISFNENEHLWTEKYRPATIKDCILPAATSGLMLSIVDSGRMPNLLLSGPPGTGKTTAAKALCNELDCDWMFIPASEDSGIDVLRTKIRQFASTTSLTGNGKVVILDEADHLQKNSTQPALRSAIEEFSKNCSFIFTCNYPNLIIEPLRSRLKQIDFSIPSTEKAPLALQLMKRTIQILELEGVVHDKKVVAAVIQRYFPDNRKVLTELNSYAKSGKIDVGILEALKGSNVDKLVELMKNRDFKEIRQWAADTSGYDTSAIYEGLYKVLYEKVKPSSIPEVILTLEEYQRFDGIVPSKEVHLVALAVSLMASVEWKA